MHIRITLQAVLSAFFLFFACQFSSNRSYGQILSYGSDTLGALASVATNATGTALTRVNGATHPTLACGTGFSATSYTTATTYSTTLPAIEVTATPNTGYTLNVTGFTADLRRSTTGPANARYAYSIDGGTTWTNEGTDQIPNNAGCGVTTTGAWTTSVTVAAPATLKFRIYGFNASSATGTFQVLNLIINGTVTGSSTGCGTATGLSATSITTTSAVLNWAVVTGATSYNIQYRVSGTSTWSTTTSGTTSVSISGLTPGTLYEYQVQAVCASGTGSFTPSSTFTTLSAAGCGTATGLSATSITTTSAMLNWTAVTGATSYNIHYRVSGTTTWSSTTSGTTSVSITGLTPGTICEYQVQAVCASGTGSYTTSSYFTTLTASTSTSSGKMAVYFNTPVDNSVSTGENAIYLHNTMADTLVAYINRAKYSIDIAQYDYNQSSSYANIATAVNNAYAHGLKVRWIYDGSQPNTGLTLLSSGIHKLASPTTSAYGIMHDKFVIIDANSSNPNDAIVSTGSEDWGVTQFNTANNNMVYIQDSSLAHAYLHEFNMMWGDTGVAPNASLAKFGPYKTDLGAHIFNIGGKTVELYFSPSDHTDTHIQSSINSANTDLYFGVYTFTVAADANAISARHTAGVYTAGIVDQYSTSGAAYPILTSALGTMLKTFTSSTSIYHNKMLIVDPSNTCSDPLVLTGSHNWTTAANMLNDENTLIIHSDTIANVYYQSFHANFVALGVTLTTPTGCSATTCGDPTGLFATTITPTSALLTWTAVTGATSYSIQYRVVGTSTWSTTTSSTNSVTITGLTPATAYEYQVETICASGTSTYSSSVTFTTLALPCTTPVGLTVTSVTSTSATLSWTAVSGATGYNIQYRIVGTSTWSTTTSGTNSVTISGLTPGASYEFQVQAICASGVTTFSASTTFSTPAITCGVPTTLTTSSISFTSVTLNWAAVTGAASYSIQYRVVGTTAWSYASTAATTYNLTGLSLGTTYEWQVQAICSATDSSGYTGSSVFTTLYEGVISQSLQDELHSLSVVPNPTATASVISYQLVQAEEVSLKVFDITGREVMTVGAQGNQQPGLHQTSIDLPAQGLYFVKLTIGQATITSKLVKL